MEPSRSGGGGHLRTELGGRGRSSVWYVELEEASEGELSLSCATSEV